MKSTPSHRGLSPAVLVAGVVALAWLGVEVRAVDFAVRTPAGEDLVLVGAQETIDLDIAIRNDSADPAAGIQGFQMAIAHDAEFVGIEEIDWEGTALDSVQLNGRQGPDFFLVNTAPAGGTGITLGVVFQQQSLAFLLGEGDHVVSRARYLAKKVTPVGSPTRIEFAPSLGDPPIENKYTVRSGQTLAAASTAGAGVAISDVAYSIHFSTGIIAVDPGADVAVPIELINAPLGVSGFSFGVQHDAARLTFKELRAGAGLTAVIGDLGDPEASEDSAYFYALDASPDGGDGFTVAMILGTRDDSKFLDPIASPHALFEAVYTARAQQGPTDVAITGALGAPPVPVILDLLGTARVPAPPSPAPPTTVVVNVGGGGEGVPFLRGDVDQGGSVNITDAVSILDYLFSIDTIRNPGVLDTIAECLVALNINGSTIGGEERASSVNITDVVVLLDFQFRGGARPAAPFPACGVPDNSVADDAKCVRYTCR